MIKQYILLLNLVNIVFSYYVGQYKIDLDNMSTDNVGKTLIKELRAHLRKTDDLAEIMIFFNRIEGKTSQLHMEQFHDQCDDDLTNIDNHKQLMIDSKYHIASLNYKIKFLSEQSTKFQAIIEEKQDLIQETNGAVSEMNSLRTCESELYEKRRTQLTMASGVIRKSKGLIGQLIPKNIVNLAPQTKFAKTDSETVSYESIQQDFIELRSYANEQFGDTHPYSRILESFTQLTQQQQQQGNLEHVNQVVDLLGSMEKELGNLNLLLYNAELQKSELHERLIEHTEQYLEQVEGQIEELDNLITEMSQQIDDHQQEVEAEAEHQQNLQNELDSYIDAHEMTISGHNQEISDRIMKIKLIRILKLDFLNEFDQCRRYILSSRFHFKE